MIAEGALQEKVSTSICKQDRFGPASRFRQRGISWKASVCASSAAACLKTIVAGVLTSPPPIPGVISPREALRVLVLLTGEGPGEMSRLLRQLSRPCGATVLSSVGTNSTSSTAEGSCLQEAVKREALAATAASDEPRVPPWRGTFSDEPVSDGPAPRGGLCGE